MRSHRESRIIRPYLLWIFLFVLAMVCSSQLTAQAALDYTEKKEKVLGLYKQSRFVEAAPILEELAAANPNDKEVFSMLGFSLYSTIGTTQDEDKRKDLADRARKALLHARELGDRSVLTDQMLANLAGGTPSVHKFSSNADADQAMLEAERLFTSGQLEGAIELYKKALSADPGLYNAALYIGDCYYKVPGKMDEAPEWYAKAIAIDPNRETAYRYWADVLIKQGKPGEARDKYIDAYISEPSDRLAISAFKAWAKGQNVTLTHPAIQIPTKVETKDNKNTTITLDPGALLKKKKDDGSEGWLIYGITRSLWVSSKFAKEYPNEKTYRHSLKEEADALRAAIAAVGEKARKSKDLDPSLATLIRLDQDGVLEPYILLARSDAGIAQDYPGFLKEHRDLLHRYATKWIISKSQ